jgi:hypothetical protein
MTCGTKYSIALEGVGAHPSLGGPQPPLLIGLASSLIAQTNYLINIRAIIFT